MEPMSKHLLPCWHISVSEANGQVGILSNNMERDAVVLCF